MSEKPDSIWYYFHRPVNGAIRCKHCTGILQQDSYKSTGNLIRHLDKKHSEKESHRKKAIEDTKKKRENAIASIPKITLFASSDPKSANKDGTELHTPEKRARIHSGGSQSIHECFTQWKKDGSKTKKLDRIIAEIIAVDILPLRTTEKIGFQRLLKYLAPNYELKARTFFTQEIGRTYDELFERVKKDLAAQNSISVTTDIWTSSQSTLSILSLTAHFIRHELSSDTFEPTVLLISARQIKGSHTGQKISEELQEAFDKMNIDRTKIHLVLRDAQSAMRVGTNLLGCDSQDCFLHKMQLAINDGIKMYTDFSPLTERMKKIIRKIRKSTLQREYFQKLQEEMALPQHVLLKATEVRWNSLYQMCDRFYQNKRAISLFIENSVGGIQNFTDVDWELIYTLVEQLKPIFIITKELEKRRSTISSVVPIYRALLNKLRKFNTAFSNRVADGLENRMTGWEMKRKLIVPSILDPNFKMDFFDREMREMYKMWLVDELVQNVEVRLNPNIEPEIEADVACTSERSTPISILEEFVQENGIPRK